MPPRLNALLAAEAPLGVVFRRGPSKRVQLFVWNRIHDTFIPGSTFYGRLYVDRSDLSPDGIRLLYFAMGGVAWAIPATGGTWSAISTLPVLKADVLWAQGGTWVGGGVWVSNNSYWLDADYATKLLHDHSHLHRLEQRPPFPSRWERDGWVRTQGSKTSVQEKRLESGWRLRMRRWYRGYSLESPAGETFDHPEWEWAEWDRHRLVWTEQGLLRSACFDRHHALTRPTTIHDFNG